MSFARRTLRFGSGLVLGAAVSTAISVLLAPRSGAELQGEIQDRVEEARRAGEEAEVITTEQLKQEYRRAVNNPSALTGMYDHRIQQSKEERERAREAQKAQKEAEKARKREDQADEDLRKAQQELEKARQQEAKTDRERAEAEKQAADARARAAS